MTGGDKPDYVAIEPAPVAIRAKPSIAINRIP